MTQSVTNGWVVEGDTIILCPVVGFKVKPIAGKACALQFNYYADRAAAEKNEVRAVQLAIPQEGLEQLLKVLQQVQEQLHAQPDGAAG